MLNKLIIPVILIVTLIGGGYWFSTSSPSSSLSVDSNAYQAVFLSNGQVYFGKVETSNPDYLTLSSVYYLVAESPLQGATSSEVVIEEEEVLIEGEEEEVEEPVEEDSAVLDKPRYTLIRLGSELHAPENKMMINQQHVLFVENLQEDSGLAQKIAEVEGGRE